MSIAGAWNLISCKMKPYQWVKLLNIDSDKHFKYGTLLEGEKPFSFAF